MKELNKKLAEWAGFHFVEAKWRDTDGCKSTSLICYDSNNSLRTAPEFTDYIDNCFDYLLDGLIERYGKVVIHKLLQRWVAEIVFDEVYPSLALSKAIEKLIDKED